MAPKLVEMTNGWLLIADDMHQTQPGIWNLDERKTEKLVFMIIRWMMVRDDDEETEDARGWRRHKMGHEKKVTSYGQPWSLVIDKAGEDEHVDDGDDGAVGCW